MILKIAVLILLMLFFMLRMRRILSRSIAASSAGLMHISNEYDDLLRESNRLKLQNTELQRSLEETVVLYELTREICKSLNEEDVFHNFQEQVNRYIQLKDCKFTKNEADLASLQGYMVLPLRIHNRTVGYLAADGIKEEEQQDKFHILAHQFMLGIKKALLYQEVQGLAITDSLTATYTRRYYTERFGEELQRSQKLKYSFSYLMIDIDYFKSFNDRYGHLVGDAILKEVTKTIKENTRQIDLVGRYGGEEFVALLIETDKEGARFAAERIRQAIAERNIRVYDEDLRITISIGIATYPEDAKDTAALIEKADQALYRAKEEGRNRVCA